jgi:shikimate kinase
MNIILIGFKNAGKTTIGQQLAEQLQWPFFDTDELLKNLYNHVNSSDFSVPEIYKREKADGFRAWEQNAIESLLETEDSVIATGGGCVLTEENVAILKRMGKVIYLQVSANELLKRQENTRVPAFMNKADPTIDFLKIYAEREPIYEKIADSIVEVENKDSIDIIAEIVGFIIKE